MGNLRKRFSSLGNKDDYETMRKHVDGKDQLIGGSSVHGGGAAGHDERVRRTPEWANNDAQVRAILLKAFPGWNTNKTQYNRSLRWIYIIQHYFRMGEKASSVAMELSHMARTPAQVAADWDANAKHHVRRRNAVTVKQVTDTVRRISRVAQGFRANGEPRMGKPGRPKLR
jgi:hypothetical protein